MSKLSLLPVSEHAISFLQKNPTISDSSTKTSLEKAALQIQSGALVAFPTETVYGLGADATCSEAVKQIFRVKGRPADNPLIAHVDSMDMLQRYIPAPLPPIYAALADRFWPGPLTMLFSLPIPSPFAAQVTANQPTVAIRMPMHPVARALIHMSDRPLAAPSANTSGRPSPTCASHVLADMQAKASTDPSFPDLAILQGSISDVGLESTVVDGITNADQLLVLRPGGIGPDAISSCLEESGLECQVRVYGRDWKDAKIEAAPSTPGMKYRHYSPACPVICLQSKSNISGEEFGSYLKFQFDLHSGKLGFMSLSQSHLPSKVKAFSIQSFDFGSKPEENAARLFEGLRSLESAGADLIFVECPSNDEWSDGIGVAVQERLIKSSGQSRAAWKVFN